MIARESILAKIRALRAKTVANGCTEAEMLAASTKARAMCDAYGVTDAELNGIRRKTPEQPPHAEPRAGPSGPRPGPSAPRHGPSAPRPGPKAVVEERPVSVWWLVIPFLAVVKIAFVLASHNDTAQKAARLQQDYEARHEEQLRFQRTLERALTEAERSRALSEPERPREPQQRRQQSERLPANLPPGYERLGGPPPNQSQQRLLQQQLLERVPDPNLPPGYERYKVGPWKAQPPS